MAVQVRWGNVEKTVLIYTFGETLEWEAFHRAFERGQIKTRSVAHAVDVILNFSRTQCVPAGGLNHLKIIFARNAATASNLNQMVIVGANGLIWVLLNIVRNLCNDADSKARMLEAHTLKQAHDLLKKPVGAGSL